MDTFLATPDECAQLSSYMTELDLWWLMILSALIFFTLNCCIDSYYLRKYFSKLKFKLEVFFYKNLMKRETYNLKGSEKGKSAKEHTKTQETLRAKDLFKSYSGKPVVRNISFNLNKQECLGILGVNGAGKTTTFRMLTRDECIDEGKVDLTVNDKRMDIDKDEVGYKIKNMYVFIYYIGQHI